MKVPVTGMAKKKMNKNLDGKTFKKKCEVLRATWETQSEEEAESIISLSFNATHANT